MDFAIVSDVPIVVRYGRNEMMMIDIRFIVTFDFMAAESLLDGDKNQVEKSINSL